MKGQENNLITQFLINFPITLVLVFVDVLIIKAVNKKFTYGRYIYFVVILDLILTSAFVGIVNIGINFLFLSYRDISFSGVDYLGSAAIAILANCIVVLMIEVFLYNRKQLEAEKRAMAAEKEKIQYMYDTLRSQVNPHFLFNSLNTLSSLIYENQDKANTFTKKLSGLYRYTLSLNERKCVSLSEELSFLESYLYLMQVRFDTALIVKIERAVSNNDGRLIPMSIQLLVENAVKHNIITKTHPLIIDILTDDNGVAVSNNLQPKDAKDKTGFGLKSLQEQYALHFKSIKIIKEKDTFTVRVPFL